ncbi:MAG: ABC transporter ATP-binding protein [Nitrospirota bacterium]
MIEVVDLYKSFPMAGKQIDVLNGISLKFNQRDIVAIVGASGAGKSTLLHILGALDSPTSGKILFEGVDICAEDDIKRARFRNEKIGFVFQFHHLLPEFTALENVMMPGFIQSGHHKGQWDRKAIESNARNLLDRVGLADRLSHRPGELSGGEQQRVALARALLLRPAVVLADEPTGNLDTDTGNKIFDLITELNQQNGTAFIIVTHNERLAMAANRIIKMVDGKLEQAL